ncbi:MAG: hypothetical protein ACXVI3_04545 [Halobacteriota archaeon]
MSCMPRAVISRRYKAAYTVLYESELEQCVAKRHLQHEKELAERALVSITDTKACDLGSFHKAEASVQWWGLVVAMTTRIVEEQQKFDRAGRRHS